MLICTHLASGKIAYTMDLPIIILAMTQVTTVTVSPSTVSMVLPTATTQQFTASLSTIGSPTTSVIWSISGQTSSNTKISASGLLTVGSDETIPSSIIVTAISVFDTTKYGTARANISWVSNYDYTGAPQTFVLQSGTYIIECWGAQGGDMSISPWTGVGGRGAYTKGNLTLTSATTIYAFIGSRGGHYGTETTVGGWNGGGSSYSGASGGGGATDIRLTNGSWDNVTSLRSRIMVAAGGGGSNDHASGGEGGKLVGGNGAVPGGGTSGGGTQTSAGSCNGRSGGFGYGGGSGLTNGYDTGGGGSGYYGGSQSGSVNTNAGGGGSSFISGYLGCDAINSSGAHTGQPNHYSGLVFTDAQIIAGNASMPNPRGTGNITGNSGNGYVKITRIA